MAKRAATFNFGANAKPKRTKKKKTSSGKKRGSKSNAWRAYVSNAPIPD